DVKRDAERLRHGLDGAVVVGRPEPAGDEHGVAVCKRLLQHPLELGRRVADDGDPRRLEAEPQRLAREERPVEIGSLAAHELAARDDDDGPGPTQACERAVFVGVTTTLRFRRAGSETGLPASLNRTPAGRRIESQKRFPRRNSASPAFSVPWKTTGPVADRRRISRYVPLPRPTNWSPFGGVCFCAWVTIDGVELDVSPPPTVHATIVIAVNGAIPRRARSTH